MVIEILFLLLALVIAYWLFNKFVVPAIPPTIAKVIVAIVAIIVIVYILNKYAGLGL